MAYSEIENFLKKFHQLWSNGLTAHLDLDTHAGQAWVGLRVKLGSPSNVNYSHTTSRQRRRERRAAARVADNAEEVLSTRNEADLNGKVTTEESVNPNVSNCVNEESTENVEHIHIEESDDVSNQVQVAAVEAVAILVNSDENETNVESPAQAHVTQNYDVNTCEDATATPTLNENFIDGSIKQATVSDVIKVYAIATIDNCPDQDLNEEYGDSLRRFVHCEHHLKENITSIEVQHLSTRSQQCNKFVHTISVIMHVKTSRLWECPAKYVRKHLGLDNYWTRSNGTVVRMSRIHKKE